MNPGIDAINLKGNLRKVLVFQDSLRGLGTGVCENRSLSKKLAKNLRNRAHSRYVLLLWTAPRRYFGLRSVTLG